MIAGVASKLGLSAEAIEKGIYADLRGSEILRKFQAISPDEVFLRYGFYLEGVINIYYEGASGNAKIKRILETYRASPPTAFGNVRVTKFEDFGRQVARQPGGYQLTDNFEFKDRGTPVPLTMKFAYDQSGAPQSFKLLLLQHTKKLDL